MKKLAITLIALQCMMGIITAQSISLTNTFGGNADDTGTSDFLMIGNNGDKSSLVVGDRVQLDVASENLDSRVRMNIPNDGSVNVKGYANIRPISSMNFILGNNFFWKWTIDGAYLNATEDFTNHGKLVNSNGAGVVFNYTTDNITYTIGSSFGTESDLNLNFGAQVLIKDIVSFGMTTQNVIRDSRSFSAYASINAIDNVVLNVGYTYNPNDTYYLSGQQIYSECKDAYMINDNVVPSQDSTQHMVQLSAAYDSDKFSIYADLMSGLNNKYYVGDNSFDELKSNDIPVYSAIKLYHYTTTNVTTSIQIKYNHWLGTDDSYDALSIYPAIAYVTKVGTFNTGARVFINAESGFNGISIPFSWQYKIKFNK